jgi:xanthine/CO dehydrogenase XdhC/CoxF family maturation factor
MSLLTQTEVYDEITRAQAAGDKLAVATIITTSGSTPQRTGAKLLVYEAQWAAVVSKRMCGLKRVQR